MELELTDQLVVVVGAAQGIGYAIAQTFAEAGGTIVLIDRSPAVIESAGALSTAKSGTHSGLVVDATDYVAMKKVADRIEQDIGSVDHVVYAVGIGSGKTGPPFWNLTPDDWRRVYDVNVQGAVNSVHAFVQPMIERQQGSLLLLGSVAGQIGSQTDPPYSASKAALINFGQCAAKDLAPHNVRVNILNPGMVKTKLTQSIWAANVQNLPEDKRPDFDAWSAEKLNRVVPLKRWQEPEDIASMALFLTSAQAKNITGQTINVDGGFVMHS